VDTRMARKWHKDTRKRALEEKEEEEAGKENEGKKTYDVGVERE